MRFQQGLVFLSAGLLCYVLAAVAHADMIVLTDGNKLTGTVTSLSDSAIGLRADYGTLTIARANIALIHFGTELPVVQSEAPAEPSKEELARQAAEREAKQQYDRGVVDGQREGLTEGRQKGAPRAKRTVSAAPWLGC